MNRVIKGFFLITTAIVFFRLVDPTFFHFAGDLNHSFPPEVDDQLRLPQMWGVKGAEGLGENTSFILWSYPLTYLLSLFAKLTGSYNLAIITFGYIGGVTLAIYSLGKLTTYFKINDSAKYVSIILYLLNTYFVLLLDGGQVSIALAYAFLPIVILKIFEAVEGSSRDKVIAGVFSAVLGFLEIRYFLILLTVLVCRFIVVDLLKIFKNPIEVSKKWFTTGFVCLIVFILFHFYWILPSIITRLPALPTGYERVGSLSALSFVTFGHSLLLLQPHWFKNTFGNVTTLLPIFYLLPILVFATPIIVKRSRDVLFWLILAVVGLFLSKGPNPPISGLYEWMFTNFPGFSFFRDTSKFFVITVLSYSLLAGYLFTKISSTLKPKVYTSTYIIFCIYLLTVMSPVWSGKLTGTFDKNPNENEYSELAAKLSLDQTFGRVLWLPSKPSLGYSTPIHPSLEAIRIFDERPFAGSVVGSYEVFNFIREGKAMGELFDVFGIKYIGYPFPDERKEEMKDDNREYYHSFLDQISNLSWIDRKVADYPVTVLETKKGKDKFFVADNTWVVIGSDRIYDEIAENHEGKLTGNAFIFAEDFYDVRRLLKNKEVGVLVYELAGFYGPDGDESFYTYEKPMYLSDSLHMEPGNDGWWKRENTDYFWTRNFLREKYGIDYQEFTKGKGIAIAEGNRELTVKTADFGPAEYLFGRVLVSDRGGKISFYQGERLVGEVKTKIENPEIVNVKLTGYREIPDKLFEYQKSEFYTNQFGKLDKNFPTLTIKTEGDINIINFLSTTSYENIHAQNELHGEKYFDGKFLNWNNLSDLEKNEIFKNNYDIQPSFKRFSPTKYNVQLSGVDKGSTLVFSEKYDEFWQLKNLKTGKVASSYPVYSQLNGFYVDEDGDYEVYYSPQKYILPGFSVSLVSGVLLLFFIIRSRNFKTGKV